MNRIQLILARTAILVLALAIPVGIAVLLVGMPKAFDLPSLNSWAPIKSAGPSTQLLAEGVTRLAGPVRSEFPDWFGADDQTVLAQAETALRANRFQEGLGHLMVLSSHLEQRGKTLGDFLPLVAPDIANWLIATYFAPLLLGTLLAAVALLILAPWLFRRLIDTLKVLAGLAAATAATALTVSLCLTLSGTPAVVFTLIEYLVAVVALTIGGNVLLFLRNRRNRPKAPALPAPSAAQRIASQPQPAALPAPPG